MKCTLDVYYFILSWAISTIAIPKPLSELEINLNIKEKDTLRTPVPYESSNNDYMSSSIQQDCYCGIRNFDEEDSMGRRISHGTNTDPNEFPWMVYLMDKNKNKNRIHCGGSIISSKTILTAQHCTEDLIPEDFVVVVAEHNKDWDDDGQEHMEIDRFIGINKIFKGDKIQKDYALVILKEELKWSRKIKPICLPEKDPSSYEDVKAIVTGWGSTLGEGPINYQLAPILQKAEVQTMTSDECAQSSPIQELVVERDLNQNMSKILAQRNLCVYDPIQFPCAADSGGPLIFEEESGYYSQIGVVSWGNNVHEMCRNTEEMPAIFAKVTAELAWIKKHMEGNICNPPSH